MKKRFLLSLLFIQCFGWALKIQVIDMPKNLPAVNLECLILETLETIRTDGEGVLSISFTNRTNITLAPLHGEYVYEEKSINLVEPPLYVSFTRADLKSKKLAEIRVKDTFGLFGERRLTADSIAENMQINFNDAIKTLQSQPGVSFSGSSMDASIFIQGGGDLEFSSFYDGIYLPHPVRWGSAVSIFNPTILKEIGMHTAGHSAKFGQGLSAALDVKLIEPDRKKTAWYAAYDSGVEGMVHGPMGKKVTYLLQARRTWVDFFGADSDRGIRQFPFIYDMNLKINYFVHERGRFDFLLYGSREGLDVNLNQLAPNQVADNQRENAETDFGYRENNFMASMAYAHVFRNGGELSFLAAITPRWGDYQQKDNGVNGFDIKLVRYPYQFSAHYSIPMNQHRFSLGTLAYFYDGELRNEFIEYKFDSSTNWVSESDVIVRSSLSAQLHNFYVSDDIEWETGVRLHLGLHGDFFSGSGDWNIWPRVALEWKRLPFKASLRTGVYTYHEFDPVVLLSEADKKSQKAYHLILSGEFIAPKWFIGAELFYKYYWDLFARDLALGFNNNAIRHVYGGDIYFRWFDKRFLMNGSFAYTFAWAREWVSGRSGGVGSEPLPNIDEGFVPDYLRPHTISALFQIRPFQKIKKRFKNKRFEKWVRGHSFALEFKFLSGQPFTPIEDVVVIDTGSEKKFHKVYGAYNSERTPAILHLDFRWESKISHWGEVFVVVANLLNRANVLRYNNKISQATVDNVSGFVDEQRLGARAAEKRPIIDVTAGVSVRGGMRIRF